MATSCTVTGLYQDKPAMRDPAELICLCLSCRPTTLRGCLSCQRGMVHFASMPSRISCSSCAKAKCIISPSSGESCARSVQTDGRSLTSESGPSGWNLVKVAMVAILIIIEREKARWVEDFLFDTDHATLHDLQSQPFSLPVFLFVYGHMLSGIAYPHKRLISRFRCGCHGLHIDTGRFGKGSEHCSREDKVCLVCMSGSVEDEHHFLFDCPAYSHRPQQYSHFFH